MQIKSLFKAVFIITIFSILTKVLGFVFRIFLSRGLGAEQLGIYQMALSVFGIFSCLVSSGLPLALSRRTAELSVLNQKQKEHASVTAAFLIGLILSIVAALLILTFKFLLTRLFLHDVCYTILLSLIPAIFANSIYSVFRGNLWGHKNYFAVCIAELFEQVVRIGLCILLFTIGLKGLPRVLITSITLSTACILASVLAIILYFKQGGRLQKPQGNFIPILQSSVPITSMRLVGSLLMPFINIVIPMQLVSLGWTKSNALAALGIMMGMVFPLLYLPTALTGSLGVALVPDLAAQKAKGRLNIVAQKARNAVRFSLLVSFICLPVFWGLSTPIAKLLYDNVTAGIYLKNTAWIIVPIALSGISNAILNSLGLESKSFKNYAFSTVFLFGGCLLLPKFIGINAFALSFGIALSFSALLNILMIQKALKKRIGLFKDLAVLILFSFLAGMLGHSIYTLLHRILPLFISLLISGIIVLSSFITLLLCLNFMDAQKIYKRFRTVLVKRLKKQKESVLNLYV